LRIRIANQAAASILGVNSTLRRAMEELAAAADGAARRGVAASADTANGE
jgi:hypothetical protein